MLILHCLLVRKKNCIFIMPFVSIVQEKVQLMQPFGEHLNFNVEEYAGVKGNLPPIKRLKKCTLYICTIEKANSLINSLIEADRLDSEIGLVVADEMHMIGDGPRGAIYEILLSKYKYCSNILNKKMKKEKNEGEDCFGMQIVATTATLENKSEMADFLNAILYERHFRPTELTEYVKLDKQIFKVNPKKKIMDEEDYNNAVTFSHNLDISSYSNELKVSDPDYLVQLAREVIPNESCLIFCSTKKNCENVASLLSTHLMTELKTVKRDLKLKLFNEIKEENNNNICPVLRKSIQCGIAYHHSGLTTEERQLIEQAFRDGVLCLLCCTSTLAAGVNLPAKRVIIRSPYVARDFLSVHQYKQMIGRAGRAGFVDCGGESILHYELCDRERVLSLISGPMKVVTSSFQCDDSKAIRYLTLSLIGFKLTQTGADVLDFFKQTLFYRQQLQLINKNEVELKCLPTGFDYISNALRYLIEQKLIIIQQSDTATSDAYTLQVDDELKLYYSKFAITKLGLASIRSSVDLNHVHQLYIDLNIGLQNMVLSNYLHLLYLCTPYDLVNSIPKIDYDIYLRKVRKL
jgi:POLQ-like helicase